MPFKTPLFLIRMVRYEYWAWWVFYLPIIPYWLYLAFKSRSLTYFTAANPGIEAGGFFGESKIGILDKIAEQYKPRTVFIAGQPPLALVARRLAEAGIRFPLIAKPDVGERGNQVEKLHGKAELQHYLAGNQSDIIFQEFVDYELEMGVFFHRQPGAPNGKVSSVTLKKFLSVTGNGISTIEELMGQSNRARFQLKKFRQRLGGQMQQILPDGEVKTLEYIGNHCRGTLFYSGNHLINKRLHEIFSDIALPIDGFYYGRFDIKVRSLADLYAGRHIRVLELNGVSAEPAHIYDPGYTLLRAYRDFARHMDIMHRICQENIKNGARPVSVKQLWLTVKKHFRQTGALPAAIG